MSRALRLALVFLLLGGPAAAGPQLAFSFDDLPAHASLPPNTTRVDVARQFIAALKAAHLPPAVGFVNGNGVARVPELTAMLATWHDAGFVLANHTWSHTNLNQASVTDWQADVLKNEPILAQVSRGADWHWFRYPYNGEGETPQKRQAVRAFLAAHGYRIAPVTMNFADYLYNDVYANCAWHGSDQGVSLLETFYLASAAENADYSRAAARALYGRDIPYVLVVHLGAFNARMLPRLIALYRDKGFGFVTLEQAESDPYYRQYTNPSQPGGPLNFEEELFKRRLPLPPRTDYSRSIAAVCR